MPEAPAASTADDRIDVAVVGGGPAGCAAAVFVARYGLDAVVFDSGPSSLRRCAFLENYLGFPDGIDVETFLDLAQAHAREAGATIQETRVESVDRVDADALPDLAPDTLTDPDAVVPFELTLQDGSTRRADRVIAATRSGGAYLRPLGGEEMFVEHEHDGEIHEHFDPEYADVDGRTPIDGCYVASPAGERDVQAIVAAGQGAHVARRLLADWRQAQGYPEGLDEVYDWLRPASEFAGERGGRDRWREYFESRLPDDVDVNADEELRALREEYVDQVLATRRSSEAIDRSTRAGIETLVETIGTDRVLEAVDDDRLLEAIDDERLRAHLEEEPRKTPEGSIDG
ncbi:FAD-dependent oxidoreductase [Salinarchaeum laminariae]|uniref:FAD-dependent oxidoreductase n=1 Tax=Salinarchaeum laminariae TaxID=869888 RepID=UPI0020BD64FC|nr:FAD-dependent oxidoreductase [Salinarchaeum laminariae]